MNLRLLARRLYARLTWSGVLGLGLIALSLLIWFSWVGPQGVALQNLERENATLKLRIAQIAKAGIPEQGSQSELERFYRFFSATPVTTWLEKLYAAAAVEKLQLDQGEYRLVNDKSAKLLRYQITLPVTGTYVQIRQFIERALNDVPVAALDDINFKRENIAATQLQARIKFTLFLHRDASSSQASAP